MRIGFFVTGEGPHLEIAKHLISSAHKVMPDVPIFQLTDTETPILRGAEGIRVGGEMPMGVRRLTHYTRLNGDWLFLDTDVLFKRDVRSVFDKPFDVAVVSREGTYMHGTEYAKAMPYNFGVMFSRSPKFWQVVLKGLQTLPPQMREWEGEQMVTCALAQRPDFKVEVLPSAYNFTPGRREDDVSHVSILHLKGPRKAWITTYL